MTLRTALVPAYLMLCLVLGGANAAGFAVNLLLQLAALPLIGWALLARNDPPLQRPAWRFLILMALIVLLFALQLCPLPPAIWTMLPGREATAQGFRLLGLPLPWLPISLAPSQTLADFLWLLPAFAIALGMIRLGAFRANLIAWAILIVGGLSVVLGALQVIGGMDSPWYFYEITNYGHAVGFFANSNHNATLLVVMIPFLAALQASALRKDTSPRRVPALLLISSAGFLVIIVGLLINFSLAGLGLAIPASGASILLILYSRGFTLPRWSFPLVGLLTIGAVVAIMLGPFGNNLTGPEAKGAESRSVSFSKSIAAAADFMPFGSGLGSFQPIYRSRENPAEVDTVYMNHVHSDAIEIALEAGVPGILLMLMLMVWWTRRSIAIWGAAEPNFFTRAATIASGAILAHSLVDYPLRTAAISGIFAACCALMAGARPGARASRSRDKQARHLSAD